MKKGSKWNRFFISFFFIFLSLSSVNAQNSRCIFMKSESSAYNFYHLKSNTDENK